MLARRLISGWGIATALLFVTVFPAKALDWKLSTDLSEKIELDDNIQLSPDANETVFGSTTSASLTATTKNKVGEFVLDAKYGYSIFRGLDGVYDSTNVDNTAGASFTKRMKTTTFELNTRVSKVSTLFSEAEDTTITNTDTNNITYSADASVDQKLNETDNLNFSTYFTRSTFDQATDGLNANDSYGVSTKFSRDVNRTLSGGLEGAIDIFDPEDGGSTRYTLTGDLNKKLSTTLSVSGSVGVRFIFPEKRANLSSTANGITSDDVVIGYPFDFSVDYQGKTYSASAGINSSVSASSGGFLQKNSAITASASHAVNEFLKFRVNGNYNIAESINEDGTISERTSITVSPTLSYALTRDWSVDLGYQYRFRDADASTVDANKVFLTLSNSTILVP